MMTGVVDVMVEVAKKLSPADRRRLVNALLRSSEFLLEDRLRLAAGEPRMSAKQYAAAKRLIHRQRKAGKTTRYESLEKAKEHTLRLISHAR